MPRQQPQVPCCLYDKPGMTLDEAEVAMLQLYGQRAGLANGQNILSLRGARSRCGCQDPSQGEDHRREQPRTQKEFIMARAQERGLNLEIITADMVTFEPPGGPVRSIVSTRCSSTKNYDTLFERHQAAEEGRQMFIHIFVHKTTPTTSRRSPRTTGCPSISSPWHDIPTGSSASSPRVSL